MLLHLPAQLQPETAAPSCRQCLKYQKGATLPAHVHLGQPNHSSLLADHNLDDLVTLLPLPAKMARRTPRQSRSTHDVLHAPARVVPGAADQAPTPGLHEGLPAQHKRTGLDAM